MRKYWQIFKNYTQERLEYRMNIFWRVAGTLIWTPVLFALWATVINAGFGADKYTFNSLAVYYISVSFISLFTNFDQNALAMEIRRGELAMDLLKPYGYFQKFFLRFLPEKVLLFVIYLFILLIMGFNGNLFLTFISSCLAVVIAFYIALSVGSLAFWFKRVHGFNALLFSFGGLFSGSAIPLDLLPKNLLTLANYLPFKYMIFVPAKLISTKMDLFLKLFFLKLVKLTVGHNIKFF
ncbi:ABC-2 family transporter protein [Candidatus Gottesmanbacteria bacterium]|nr:ABC-2 family transporter protein [Candidatus Gottesmanbacteria bacterium]